MSGSGGGDGGSGGGGGGFGGDGGGVDCSALRYQTTLNSPVAAVIVTLKPKDILSLVQRAENGPLYAVTSSGKTAGSIAGARLMQLLKCMETGFEYEAIVIKVVGGNVEVEVRPKGA